MMSSLRFTNASFISRVVFITMIFFITGGYLQGQTTRVDLGNHRDSVMIRQIRISGNRITRNEIILRELNFKENDHYPADEMAAKLVAARENIFNTRLFNFVTIDTLRVEEYTKVDVVISVIERWYIWPIPFFEISDRNFNVWWQTRDLNRLTYGIDFTFNNARGRNETLKILTHFGFNKMFGFTYKMPFINRAQTLGLGFGGGVELNRELAVYTVNNKPLFIRNNADFLKTAYGVYTELIYRPDFYTTHFFRIAYAQYVFDSAVLAVPGYVHDPDKQQQFVSVNYLVKNDHRDVHFYPLTGYYFDLELNHSLPYNIALNSYLKTNFRWYLHLRNRWYWASSFTGKVSFEKVQSYYLQRGLGYGRDFVRGYEYYVIDGQHYVLAKNNLKFAMIPQCVKTVPFIRNTRFNTIPLALYLNAFVDIGYAYHYADNNVNELSVHNTLENSFLLGFGLGIDFATYYDIVVRLEGSFNRMLQPGLYLHFVAPI